MSILDRQLKLISKQETYDGPTELNDGEGLIARISSSANITFQYRCRFNGTNLRIKIGKYPATSLKEARRKHKIMMELRESGRNPEIANTGEQDFVTLDDCINYWLKHYVPSLKKGTQELYRSFARNYFLNAFPDRNVETIPAREWMQWLDAISAEKPKTANSIFTTLRACLNFCKSKFIIDRTDLERIKKKNVGKKPENGSRVPTWSELVQIWLAIERSRASTSNKTLHQLTMLWGNRLSELRLVRRSHFDMKAGIWTVPKELSKTNKPIRRPIPTKAHTGIDVQQARFHEVDSVEKFDGIWTCASLLHVPEAELLDTLQTLGKSLKPGGVGYLSFKYGDCQREKDGRLFTDINEERHEDLLQKLPQFQSSQLWFTEDCRPGRSEKWLNAIWVKK